MRGAGSSTRAHRPRARRTWQRALPFGQKITHTAVALRRARQVRRPVLACMAAKLRRGRFTRLADGHENDDGDDGDRVAGATRDDGDNADDDGGGVERADTAVPASPVPAGTVQGVASVTLASRPGSEHDAALPAPPSREPSACADGPTDGRAPLAEPTDPGGQEADENLDSALCHMLPTSQTADSSPDTWKGSHVVSTGAASDSSADRSSGAGDSAHDAGAPRCMCCMCRDIRQRLLSPAIVAELRGLMRLVWPVVLWYVLQQLLNIVSLLFVGRLGPVDLDGSALGIMFTSVTGISIGVGLSAALDTLCSQAFGAECKKRVGVIFQRGILILSITMFPIWAIWLNTERILVAVGQDPAVSAKAAIYCHVYMFKLPADFLLVLMQKYLQAQSIVRPALVVSIIANAVNPVFHLLFIYGLGLGYTGAPLAMTCTTWLTALILYGYVWLCGIHRATWDGWSLQALAAWGHFLQLAVPGMLMICIEWWSFEILSLLSGLLGQIELAAQIIILTTTAFTFSLPLGFSVAASVRVGNFLGAGQADRAHRTSRVALTLTVICSLGTGTVLFSTRSVLGSLYTDDAVVQALVASLMPIVAVSQVLDFSQGVLSGILRGTGRQQVGAMLNFVGYYVLGLPIGSVLTFIVGLRAAGLWYGIAIGLSVQAASMYLYVWRLDWDKEVVLARSRIEGIGASGANDVLARDDSVDAGSVRADTAQLHRAAATSLAECSAASSLSLADVAPVMPTTAPVYHGYNGWWGRAWYSLRHSSLWRLRSHQRRQRRLQQQQLPHSTNASVCRDDSWATDADPDTADATAGETIAMTRVNGHHDVPTAPDLTDTSTVSERKQSQRMQRRASGLLFDATDAADSRTASSADLSQEQMEESLPTLRSGRSWTAARRRLLWRRGIVLAIAVALLTAGIILFAAFPPLPAAAPALPTASISPTPTSPTPSGAPWQPTATSTVVATTIWSASATAPPPAPVSFGAQGP